MFVHRQRPQITRVCIRNEDRMWESISFPALSEAAEG